MDKSPGGQNGGNHCCRTEYRKTEWKKKKGNSLKDLWNNIKHTNICIMGITEREEREKRPEKIPEK